jgi:hypothetical protein
VDQWNIISIPHEYIRIVFDPVCIAYADCVLSAGGRKTLTRQTVDLWFCQRARMVISHGG